MKRIAIGLLIGGVAGLIDVTPMIIQGLTWDANLSAFAMWLVIGLFVLQYDFKIPIIAGSLILSFLVLLPTAILIAWKEPSSLIPISAMTLLLGSLVGFLAGRIKRKLGSTQ